MKKIARYRLSVSVKFPATHQRRGELTEFQPKIYSAFNLKPFNTHFEPKIHTIRANYPLWKKRFEKINKGEAVLELYYWSGKPYNSKCITICQLGKDDGIGIQKVNFWINLNNNAVVEKYKGAQTFPTVAQLAKNDALSLDDFKEWFKNYDISEPMAIIHFTKFRY